MDIVEYDKDIEGEYKPIIDEIIDDEVIFNYYNDNKIIELYGNS